MEKSIEQMWKENLVDTTSLNSVVLITLSIYLNLVNALAHIWISCMVSVRQQTMYYVLDVG